jgi:hypothetical protein
MSVRKTPASTPARVRLLLVVIAMALPLLAADLLLRALQLPKGNDRVLLLAGSPLQTGDEGYRRYEPRRRIEHSAVYGNQLAYRSHFQSNNRGLISHPDLARGQTVDLAIVGDSFGEGIGGYAWIPSWQQSWLRPRGLTSINYAIGGSGFEDFAIAARAARTQHQASKVLVLFIEHDAYRPYQRMASQPGCSYYSNGWLDRWVGPLACNLYGVVWHHVAADQSDQQRLTEGVSRQQYGLIPAMNKAIAQLNQRRQPAQVSTEPSTSSAPTNAPPLRYGAIPVASLRAISAIKALYGNQQMLLVQLPDQPQPWSSAAQAQRSAFGQQLSQASGVAIVDLGAQCPLTTSDFHQLDNHPNQNGYARLEACLKRSPEVRAFLLSKPAKP